MEDNFSLVSFDLCLSCLCYLVSKYLEFFPRDLLLLLSNLSIVVRSILCISNPVLSRMVYSLCLGKSSVYLKRMHSSGLGWSILLGQLSCSVAHIFCIYWICCPVVVSVIEKAVSKFQTLGWFLLAEVLM